MLPCYPVYYVWLDIVKNWSMKLKFSYLIGGFCLAQGLLLSACVQGPSQNPGKAHIKEKPPQDASQTSQGGESSPDMSFMDAPTAAQRQEIQEEAQEYKRILDEELKR